jgi:hypothetical protein
MLDAPYGDAMHDAQATKQGLDVRRELPAPHAGVRDRRP